ncbi:MAG: hypothetical protein LBJ64_04870 [Deltaproteobacteria bacterium]|jgi:hypothetical protein|nr:hypothetical protein [Deltaproteobacteria bacterium]
MKIYRSLREIEGDSSLIGHMRPLRRAWDALSLNSVLGVGGVPVLGHKESQTILSDRELKEDHRLFWNQGFADVLLVVDPKSFYLFSSQVAPAREDEPLAKILVGGGQNLGADSLARAIEDIHVSIFSGEFYRRYSDKFTANGSVSECLTASLRDLRGLLTEPQGDGNLSADEALNFICRLLFACCLADREIISWPGAKARRFFEALMELDDVQTKEGLYSLFKSLENMFDGCLFDQDLETERKRMTLRLISKIKSFLRGDKIDGRQASIGFWAYDFRLIPAETISELYQNILCWENEKIRGPGGVPRFLAEMTLETAGGDHEWTKRRHLDPGCGSGIFLVALFNRLATVWEIRNQEKKKADDYGRKKVEALLDIFRTRIKGIERNSRACVLACFSLYVALLDLFESSDVKACFDATGQKPPKLLLRKGARLDEENLIPVVYEGDAWLASPFAAHEFDMVIGNPAWQARADEQSVLKFLWKLDRLLADGGEACLFWPSNIFLRTESFQAEWLQRHALIRVVQLADFRKALFPEGKRPGLILHYRQAPPEDSRHQILYDAPKYSLSVRRQGLAAVSEIDRKSFSQAKVAWLAGEKKAGVFWQSHFWGTARDQRLLQYLGQWPKLDELAGADKSEMFWQKGLGLQAHLEDERLRLLLTAYWPSDVARYYSFHASSIGDDDGHGPRLEDILKLPFPWPSQAPGRDAAKIAQEIVTLLREEARTSKGPEKDETPFWRRLLAKRAVPLKKELNELVYAYFDISEQERWLIEDAVNIFAPSSTLGQSNEANAPLRLSVDECGAIPGYEKKLGSYALALTSTLNKWAKEFGSRWRVRATGRLGPEQGLASVTLRLAPKEAEFELADFTDPLRKEIYEKFAERPEPSKRERRLLWFDESSLNIVRPIYLVHWTRAAALNDADHIFAQIRTMKSEQDMTARES